MNVDVLDEIWCCFPDAHAGQICATVEGVGSRTATLAPKRFPRVALLHQDRPTVSDGNHLCDEASSQEKRRPHLEAAMHAENLKLRRYSASLRRAASFKSFLSCALAHVGSEHEHAGCCAPTRAAAICCDECAPRSEHSASRAAPASAHA
jgi:hypothetical protein